MTLIQKDLRLGLQASDVFEVYGLLSSVEAMKYKNYSGLKSEIIELILKERGITEQFEPPIRKLFLSVFLTLSAIVSVLYLYQDEIIEKLVEQANMNASKDPYSELPLIVKSMSFNFLILGGFFMVCLCVFLLYKYFYNHDRKFIYKYIKLKEYDDSPLMFSIMFNFHKHYGQTNIVFKEMQLLAPYKGLGKMFEDLETATTDSDSTYYDIFKSMVFLRTQLF